MATSIHPHKGYLNTKFQFHVTGHDSLDYEIVTASNETQRMFYGKVSPNEPFGHTIPIAGNFKIKFSDGSIIPITVEDGYKFGGGKFKDAFVFDNCPWAFIIMHDRTYFYNRDTEEAYLETVSPDKITEINENYVLFESKCQEKYTIYSLDEQKPILCVSDIRFFNEEILVWCEEIDNTTKLFFYSVNEQEIKKEVDFDQYVVDKKNQRIIYSKSSQVISISLNINLYTSILKETFQGELVCMKAPNLAISYESTKNGNYLYAYDLDSDTLLKKITVHGYLSSIENNKLIDLWIRKQDIRNFDIKMYVCPEAVVIADYEEFVFYPCNCDVFYSVKHIQLKKSVTEPLSIKEEYSIHSCGFEIDQSIDCHFQSMATYGSCVCLYNSNTSFVFDKRLSRSIYSDNGKIYQEDGRIYRYVDSTLYILDTDGNWVDGKKHSYDFQYFEQFCIVIDNESKYVYKLNGQNLGKWECANYINTPFIKTSDYCILPQAKFVKSYRSSLPQYYSFDLGYGIKVTGEEVHFYTLINGQYSKTQILTDLFDSSQYKNVLFSEDGQYIMHRDGHQTVVMDVVHETVDIYNNLSYVEHINGIRPLFETPTSFQPRLIDPVTRQTIDCKRITQYQFISPDKRLYADTRLEEYVEHYYKDDGNILTREEYKYLLEKYEYPCDKEKDSDEWNRIIELRKQFILKHIDCLDKDTKEMICKDDTYCNWEIKILDTINIFDVKRFLSLVIGERGMAYIRKTSDDSVFAKIPLGEPLSFINYVSFSYNSRYVSIAGFNWPKSRGLFLIYDLELNDVVANQETSRAVWMTTFSRDNAVASYTSHPFTFFASDEKGYNNDLFKSNQIDNRSFLTFSPDGKYFALSEQGYTSKYDQYGNEQSGWGHQASSLVEIRRTRDCFNICLAFTDLSEQGIAEEAKAKSVASVSFSNDNKRLMMVGNDGVVVIRNLKLENNASK